MVEQRFRRQRYRLWVPLGIGAYMLGTVAVRVPGAALPAGITGVVLLGFASLLHYGIILTEGGISWYVLHPRFIFRRIPWTAVKSVHPRWFGMILGIDVEPGHYEPTLWGVPRGPLKIHTRELVRGDELLEVIESFRGVTDPSPAAGSKCEA